MNGHGLPFAWRADFIAPSPSIITVPRLWAELKLSEGHGPVTRAVLHATAHGVFEARIDGQPVSDDVLSPGWSSYEWRLPVVRTEVTQLVAAGQKHILSFLLAKGWYADRLGWMKEEPAYGADTSLSAGLMVTFEDGYTQSFETDSHWSSSPSEVVSASLYDGQIFDFTSRSTADLPPDTENSFPVRLVPIDTGRLFLKDSPPIRRRELISVKEVRRTSETSAILDFGQNLVGWVRLDVKGARGQRIRLRHSEVLDQGKLSRRPLRSANAEDTCILDGLTRTIEPTFTFHGFRYAQIDGWNEETDGLLEDIQAVAVGSELERVGWFECSNPLLNQLHENAVWSTLGNFLSVPTDCPQRDERLGWTGDLAVFAPAAAGLFDIAEFTKSWLRDMRAEQLAADGRVPFTVPDVLKGWSPTGLAPESTAIWSDAAVWVPWALWEAYGDLEMLREFFPLMRDHVRRVAARLSDRDLWEGDFQFGDWLDPTAPADDPFAAVADVDVVATAAFYRSICLSANAAQLLQYQDVQIEFQQLADRIKRAFVSAWVGAEGSIHSDCQTVYTLAIAFGLLDDVHLPPSAGLPSGGPALAAAGKRLNDLVEEGGYRISTGFAGTPFILDALASTGHLAAAYQLLEQTECPSWLYPVTMGATTIWERWDSMLLDGSINPGEMTSFNHYAFGSVVEWLYGTVVGIRPLSPSWSHVRVAPRPGGTLTWAKATVNSPAGTLSVSWRNEPDWHIEVDAPSGMHVELVDPPRTA